MDGATPGKTTETGHTLSTVGIVSPLGGERRLDRLLGHAQLGLRGLRGLRGLLLPVDALL